MTIWFALFKKELRLGWMAFLIFFILQVLLMGLGIFLNLRFGSDAVVAPAVIGVMLTLCLILYVPVYLLFNVIQERKTFHIWMQNPLPAWAMLLAKMSGAVAYLILSGVVIGGYTWFGLTRISGFPGALSLSHLSLLCALILLWLSIGGGVGFLFLWTVYRTMRSRIGRWSWLVLIVGIGIYSYVDTKLTQSGLINVLTHWGRVPERFLYDFLVSSGSTITSHAFKTTLESGSDPFYIGSIVFDLIITVIFFLITAWLSDNELEVS
ncbi:hypothetical protein ACFP7A_06135 [Sporolactobacillus kofuensis]|uniref:ABC transporter permease n=1 Tax=Sporolactobacillus kofuensis TaxID=269672 RepID=A0ABW1WEZ0_9BACL|nr:hypothetical protein [Sporolactobacillus kofuensis]MCO7175072.1 hypothetical protein [Sporolactobacillus kofuensis]